MQDALFDRSLSATIVVADVRSSIVLIPIGILGLVEAGCGPPR
ncbi:MAG TPA: hypothetical protein VN894_08585 [Polyangiaceae bacterium]|nr:hypothetical protein [Polyangiaceae bacterium]